MHATLPYRWLVSFLLYQIMIFSLQGQSDSLHQRLKLAVNTSEQLDACLALAQYHRNRPDSCLKYAADALASAQSIQDPGRESLAHHWAGMALRQQKNYPAAHQQLDSALLLVQRTTDTSRIARAVFNIAETWYIQSEYQQALHRFQSIIGLYAPFLERNNHTSLAHAYNGIAICVKALGQYDDALEAYRKARQYIMRGSNDEGGILHNMKTVAIIKNDYKLAISYQLEALQIFEANRNQQGIMMAHKGLSEIYMALGDHEKARDFCATSIAMQTRNEANPNPRELTYSYLHLARIYMEGFRQFDSTHWYMRLAEQMIAQTGNRQHQINYLRLHADLALTQLDTAVAKKYYTEGLALAKDISDLRSIAIFEAALGHLQLAAGHVEQAVPLLKESLRKTNDLPDLNAGVNLLLASAYEKKGDTRLALQHLKEAYVFKDSFMRRKQFSDALDQFRRYEQLQFNKDTNRLRNDARIQQSEFRKKTALSQGVIISLTVSALTLLALLLYHRRQVIKKLNIYLSALRQVVIKSGLAPAHTLADTPAAALLNQDQIVAGLHQLDQYIEWLQNHTATKSGWGSALQQRSTDIADELKLLHQGIAHDMMKPIARIELLARQAQQADAVPAEKLDAIALAAHQSREMLLQLLAFSKVEQFELHPTEISVGQLLEDILADIRTSARPQVSFLIPQNLPVISADVFALRSIFSNLIENALQHNADLPELEICTRYELSPDGHIFIVEDNGHGLPPEGATHIFELFSKGGRHGGHGIGLAIVKKLIEKHGGNVRAESKRPQGAAFRFMIPSQTVAG